MPSTRVVPIASLVRNWDIYPRHHVDTSNVRDMVRAEQAGFKLPPIIVDRRTKIVVDGFHRIAKQEKLGLETVEAEFRNYKGMADILEESIRLNAPHGRKLDPFDKARCLLLAEQVGLAVNRLAAALCMSLEVVEEMRLTKTAVGPDDQLVPIKNTLRPLAGKKLSVAQTEGNHKASGMPVVFYAQQLANCLEKDLVDTSDKRSIDALKKVKRLLVAFFKR